jgi:selenide,water dikinase|tara:strand:- start:2871 stop:3788 length:918 start_codon:yes stop_codon:yes gene_type:complete
LVNLATGDDAGVFRLSEELALVQTVDFIPPIIDDPFVFGEIAAANSFSDIYAMGGSPLTALNLTCFPSDVSQQILLRILEGGQATADRAGAFVIGGHTIQDKEPKYGMAVTGSVYPDAYITNATAQPGDVLVLTKPLGTGIITTAAKEDAVSEDVLNYAVSQMRELNDKAALSMKSIGVNACTDVTGFGLLGHLFNLAKASNVTAVLDAHKVPMMPGVYDLARKDMIAGGTKRNRSWMDKKTLWQSKCDETLNTILCDAQTSGGLLISVAEQKVQDLLNKMIQLGVIGTVIGNIVPMNKYHLEIT